MSSKKQEKQSKPIIPRIDIEPFELESTSAAMMRCSSMSSTDPCRTSSMSSRLLSFSTAANAVMGSKRRLSEMIRKSILGTVHLSFS
ncbi:unnamed protein product [Caenorhabditis bovis]|uniref:Uncharacterized protein n=1 Tax=Caenorhabditis bovis TaxID=2654633 RepID=A0A8S1FBU2_9PELO|nr:unnamed protein product [Caenorhabditis bovis]